MRGYQLKVFSILLSSFKEVVWVDSDNVPMMDPAEAFELKPYKATGGTPKWNTLLNETSSSIKHPPQLNTLLNETPS